MRDPSLPLEEKVIEITKSELIPSSTENLAGEKVVEVEESKGSYGLPEVEETKGSPMK